MRRLWNLVGMILTMFGGIIVIALGFAILFPEPPPLFSTFERVMGLVMLAITLIFVGGMLVNYQKSAGEKYTSKVNGDNE